MAARVNSWIMTTLVENISTPAKDQQEPSSISKVRVIVRVRPFLSREIASRNGDPVSCVSLLNNETESSQEVTVLLKDFETSRKECYKLDAFFGQEDNNVSQIFVKEVEPLIPGIFQGCNATVFAYGATGSGKTYTIQGSEQICGLMSLSMSSIMSMCNHTGSSVKISYYEIYLDKCYDLLEPKEKEIMVRNDKDEQIHLMGLAQFEVDSLSKFQEIFSSALQRRKVAQTSLNDVSSRSHGVLTVTVSTPCHDRVGNFITGKINFIDLAGNEDNRRTCNEGIRLQESAKINQSLFALSNVIYALNNSKPRIPYRESKLTRILQDSLGGTSRALMIACLNPGEYQESVYTVSLAARSRHVSNFLPSAQRNSNSKVKVDMEAKLHEWLESKGKTKSAQRMAFYSPSTFRSPGSLISVKKSNTHLTSCEKGARNQGVANSEKRTSCISSRKLFAARDRGEANVKDQALAPDDAAKEKTRIQVQDASESKACLAVIEDEELAKKKCLTDKDLSPVNEKIKVLNLSSEREALSPIDSNISQPFIVPSCPKTPILYSKLFIDENSSQMLGTPLDKFTAHSSSLKSTLIQNYIELLNTASREELQELKGIGQKIAEYIIELRETSPLKSLNDLEKIGLSSKQVHNMFGRAANGVFTKLTYNA